MCGWKVLCNRVISFDHQVKSSHHTKHVAGKNDTLFIKFMYAIHSLVFHIPSTLYIQISISCLFPPFPSSFAYLLARKSGCG